MGVALAGHPVGAQLLDGPGPRRGHQQPISARAPVVGRLGPPLGQLGILGAGALALEAERGGHAIPTVLLPQVQHLGPASGGADDGPHPIAELVALVLGDGRPVGRHVVHVVGPVVADDVDELVDVELVVGHDQPLSPRSKSGVRLFKKASTASRWSSVSKVMASRAKARS